MGLVFALLLAMTGLTVFVVSVPGAGLLLIAGVFLFFSVAALRYTVFDD